MPLRVVLAGHNLDRALLLDLRDLLQELTAAGSGEQLQAGLERARRILSQDNWTPETLSAAYARISRDPREVTALRAIARDELDKARKSNEQIVFGLGHSSVAEHAVFNFDILGLSRLGVEVLERQRLASYTEKSQRYILLDEDYVVPEEIRGTETEHPFRESLAAQNVFYRVAYERLLDHIRRVDPAFAAEKKNLRAVEGMAKEDARYSLSLATTVQLGETLNARNLEALIARCRANPLRELQDLGEALHEAVAGLAPSLIRYTEPTPHLRATREDLARAVHDLGPGPAAARAEDDATAGDAEVRLLSTTPDPDGAVVAALLFAGGFGSMPDCQAQTARMPAEARRDLVMTSLRRLGPHDSVLREYEHVDLVYELVLSASCFAQLKRHRMASLTVLPYDPTLGITLPDAFRETGLEAAFREVTARSEEVFHRIRRLSPPAAAYALTNAHRRRVLFKLNAREMYHLSRLREDAHAQWDIRRTAERMMVLARERMPLTLLLAAGKDRFDERRRQVFSDEASPVG